MSRFGHGRVAPLSLRRGVLALLAPAGVLSLLGPGGARARHDLARRVPRSQDSPLSGSARLSQAPARARSWSSLSLSRKRRLIPARCCFHALRSSDLPAGVSVSS